jgi:urease accessory protein
VITTSGCVLQGDRLALEVAVGPGARAHVTTQSATKVHSMDANYAVQTQSIALADGAYLELLPEPLIPHRRARFLSDTRISIAPTATLLWEIVQPGRKHHPRTSASAPRCFHCQWARSVPTGGRCSPRSS